MSLLFLPPEQIHELCRYLTPDSVCQLEDTCSQIKTLMDQSDIWKRQVESFPVAGIPFGDSSDATFRKGCGRWDYFNNRLLKHFLDEWVVGKLNLVNPYRTALRVKFTIDRMLIEVKDFVENDLEEAYAELKKIAYENPETDWNHRYPLKTFQIKIDLPQSDKWNFECSDYILKWIVHGELTDTARRGVCWDLPNTVECSIGSFKNPNQYKNRRNVFKCVSYVFHEDLIRDDETDSSDSDNDEDSSDDDNDAKEYGGEDEESLDDEETEQNNTTEDETSGYEDGVCEDNHKDSKKKEEDSSGDDGNNNDKEETEKSLDNESEENNTTDCEDKNKGETIKSTAVDKKSSDSKTQKKEKLWQYGFNNGTNEELLVQRSMARLQIEEYIEDYKGYNRRLNVEDTPKPILDGEIEDIKDTSSSLIDGEMEEKCMAQKRRGTKRKAVL